MQPMQLTFMALLLAHLLSDFLLQPQWIFHNKAKRIWPLICHGLIHYGLAWACLLFFAPATWQSIFSQIIILGYVAVHLIIDRLKHRLIAGKPSRDNWRVFLSDQALHILALTIATAILTQSSATEIIHFLQPSQSDKTHLLEAAIIYIAVVFGGGYLIRYLTKGLQIRAHTAAPEMLKNAGLYVGWLERFMMITAIAMQSPALVGLILTGKSIARFPEFKEPRFAEYFLIGTLLSISLSVVGGLVLLQLLYGTVSLK
ncbi:MAG TPA: DUF3307 domain-containing protein [Terracidiphilus sp.]|nr:DUF3307 domain-containing protein [Terracidiphilus sp.]